MGELRIPVEVVRVVYQCNACGNGVLEPTGAVLASNPPLYPHRCTNCGAGAVFKHRYPRTEYIPLEEKYREQARP